MCKSYSGAKKKMMSDYRSTALVLAAASLLQASVVNTLTNEENQILKDNDYTVTVNEAEGLVTYEHHGHPNHTSEEGWGNPNAAEKVNHTYTMPINPVNATVKGCAGGLGVIGLAVSGGAFYNPYTGFGWNAVEGECKEDLDDCLGHPSPDGTYHYHGVPDCLYTGDLKDKFLGVALDGFPIYGPMDSTGKNWTSAELDECHGHEYNGRYMYRATYDFPYLISCFHGGDAKPQRQNMPPPMTGGNTGTRPGPGNGQQPPGIQAPDGLENDKCWNAKYQDWDTRICRVVCENAGEYLEDCKTTVTDAGSTGFNSASIVSIWTFAFVIYLCN